MDLVGFIFGFGVLQGLILSLVLLAVRSGHRQANAMMAALVVVMAMYLLHRWMVRLDYWSSQPTLALVTDPLSYSWGPLLYLYAFTLTGGRLSTLKLLHLLPGVLLFLSINLFFWQLNLAQQTELANYLWGSRNNPAQEELLRGFLPEFWRIIINFRIHSLLFMLQFAFYCLLVLMHIREHNRRLELHFSSLEHKNLRWLRMLTLACLVYLGVYLLFNRMPSFVLDVFDPLTLTGSANVIVLVFLIYGIAFSALFQPSLISGVMQAVNSEPYWERVSIKDVSMSDKNRQESSEDKTVDTSGDEVVSEQEHKYAHSSLSIEDAQRFMIQLMEVMQKQELYLDSDLTLPDLAKATSISTHQISQVINGQMNQNFFSFVNSYRIELARSLLVDPATSGMAIVELAIEVGFKSKSSFYDAFKRATNMTPTQFKKAIQDGNDLVKTSGEID